MKFTTHSLHASAILAAMVSSCGLVVAATTLNGDYSIVGSGSGPTAEDGDLTVAGDISVGGAIDLGSTGGSTPLSALQFGYHVSGVLAKSATFDLTEPGASFVWRDNFVGAPTDSVRTKMILDENNVLSVYNATGIQAGITLNGSDGRITLNGADSGIYSGEDPVFSLDENGDIVFGAGRSFSIPNTTESSSASLSGALTVAGGIGTGMDSHFNGVRVGTGGGDVSTNTAVGGWSLAGNTTGNYNTGVGVEALRFNTTGIRNVAVGGAALLYNTEGSWNHAIGVHALANNSTGNRNIAMGFAALYGNSTGSDNVAIGQSALWSNSTGGSNVGIGTSSLVHNSTGTGNVGIGREALSFNSQGLNNTAVGLQALLYSDTGSYNTASGSGALIRNVSGSDNSAFGAAAGQYCATGTNNIMIGNNAAGQQANGAGLADPHDSIYIGSNSRGYSDDDQNSIVIGADAVGAGANTTVIGNSNTTKARIFGTLDSKKVEITATAPENDALVVDGRTRLKGQVILDEPQGDISMGIYE